MDIKIGDYVKFNKGGAEYYIKGEDGKNRWLLIDTKNQEQSIMKNVPLIKIKKYSDSTLTI